MRKYIIWILFIFTLLYSVVCKYEEYIISQSSLYIECYHCGKKMLLREKGFYSSRQNIYRIYLEENFKDNVKQDSVEEIQKIIEKEKDPFISYWGIECYSNMLDKDLDTDSEFLILNNLSLLSFSNDKNTSTKAIETICRN